MLEDVKLIRRVFIAIVGGTVLAIGVVMIVLPAPGIVVIPAGLAILALEFAWAGHLLRKFRGYLSRKRGGTGVKQDLPEDGNSK